jgi:hypothetical protein
MIDWIVEVGDVDCLVDNMRKSLDGLFKFLCSEGMLRGEGRTMMEGTH